MEEALDPKYRWFSIKLKVRGNVFSDFVYRGLTRREQRKLASITDESKSEDFILKSALAKGQEYDELPAGSYKKLVQLITSISGLTNDDAPKPFTEAMEWLDTDLGSLEAAAITVIPGCTLEALDTMDNTYYWKYLLVAQILFKSTYQIDPATAFSSKPQPAQQQAPLPSQQQFNRQPTVMVENQGTLIAKKK